MSAFLIFILLPILLIAVSFRIKPIIKPEEASTDTLGAAAVAKGMFGNQGVMADEIIVPEETEQVRFNLQEMEDEKIRS